MEPEAPVRRDGLSLALLVLVAFLLCGNLWALLRLRSESLSGATGAPVTGPRPRVKAAPVKDEFHDLLLHDLVAGMLALQSAAPSELRLSPAQIQQLAALAPQIRARLDANVRKPDPLDDQVRACLTAPQRAYILQRFLRSHEPPPHDLSIYARRFDAMLKSR